MSEPNSDEERACQMPDFITAMKAKAEVGIVETSDDYHTQPNRFKPSDTWKEDQTVAEVYETGAIDVSGWIAAAIRARHAKTGEE